jgi:hypothetical protein
MAADNPVEERMLMYLARAEEARRTANAIKNPENRALWESIAEDWQHMAEQYAGRLKPPRT